MSLSIDERHSSGAILAADLLELIRDPEKHRSMLAQLMELRAKEVELARREGEIEAREQAADATMAQATAIRASYELRRSQIEAALNAFTQAH